MWQLKEESGVNRLYVNSATGSRCNTTKLYTDKDGNNWHGFNDLMSLPYTRQFAANKISSLYALGLSKDDLNAHVLGLKTILKSDDKEKYEKAFSLVLDFESKASNATDAIKQMSSLVCVYYLINDEQIDSFDNGLQIKKMALLEADVDLHCFFLSHQTSAIENYTQHLNLISQIVSQSAPEK